MDGYGLLAGLLGGYAQGRQLRQNRDIRRAQIERQITQDAYTRAHQAKMENYAARRLKLAENPIRNLDPAAGINFDRTIADINKYYQDWHTRLGKAGTINDIQAILNEGTDALPGFRARIQANIDRWGKDIGYEGADPDMFLQPMHGMRTKYDPATGRYSYVDKDEFRRTYAPKTISNEDMAYVKSQQDAIRRTISNPEQQRAAMAAVKQGLIAKYGEDAANAAIPFLPLDDVPIGQYQTFVPKEGGYQPYTPEAGFKLPTDINPAIGQSTDTSSIRRILDPAKLAAQFGADAPDPFASEADKRAYEDARYKPGTGGFQFTKPFNLDLTQGPYNFNAVPIPRFDQAEYTDPKKEFRRAFMNRVMSGPAAGTTEEEVGLGTLVQMFQRTNPDFNPFKNAEDARKIVSLVRQRESPMFHAVVARIANEGGYERQEGKIETRPLTSKYELTPYESTNAADAAGKLSDQKVIESKELLPYRVENIKSQITERANQEKERRWQRWWEQYKFSDISKRGWTSLGISQGNLDLNQLRFKLQEKITNHNITTGDIKLVQSLYKHMDNEQKMLQQRLKTVESAMNATNQRIGLNGGSLSHLTDTERQQVIDGTMPASVRAAKITGTVQAQAAADLRELGVLQSERKDIEAQIKLTSDDVLEAKTWESNMRAVVTGFAARKEADVKALIKEHGWSLEQATSEWENGTRPSSGTPKPAGKAPGKASGKQGGMPERVPFPGSK